VWAEYNETPFVDQLAERVDHGLDRAFGQALYLSVNHLYRPVDLPVLDGLVEHQIKRLGQIILHFLRI
jgi:hypothetical protein